LANNIGLGLSLRDRGIYIVGLTHAGKNRLADGNAVFYPEGITPAGREVIHMLNDNNILIDVAHLHPACFYQLMDLVERPCVSTHTGIRERDAISRETLNLNRCATCVKGEELQVSHLTLRC
jgi:microsomal dipeptidase-like Zn-dependent dipeptidase